MIDAIREELGEAAWIAWESALGELSWDPLDAMLYMGPGDLAYLRPGGPEWFTTLEPAIHEDTHELWVVLVNDRRSACNRFVAVWHRNHWEFRRPGESHFETMFKRAVCRTASST